MLVIAAYVAFGLAVAITILLAVEMDSARSREDMRNALLRVRQPRIPSYYLPALAPSQQPIFDTKCGRYRDPVTKRFLKMTVA